MRGPGAGPCPAGPLLSEQAVAELCAVCEDQPGLLDELLATFAEDARTSVEAMLRSARAGDANELRRCAHALKGMAGQLGAKLLAGCCATIEQRARDGTLDEATVDAKVLGEIVEQTLVEAHVMIDHDPDEGAS